jgi:hypothetical protein
MDRNFSVHRNIDNYIDDVLSGHSQADGFIKHMEQINKIRLVISNTQEDLLMKLTRFNILSKKERKEM